MSSVNSTSSLEQVQASYDDNASYAEDVSPAKARAFITAARILIRRIPRSVGKNTANMTLTPDLLLQEIASAQEWLSANDVSTVGGSNSAARVTRVDFQNFR